MKHKQGVSSLAEQQNTLQRISASDRLLVEADLLPCWQVQRNLKRRVTSFAEQQKMKCFTECGWLVAIDPEVKER